jgi:hypothetical protein
VARLVSTEKKGNISVRILKVATILEAVNCVGNYPMPNQTRRLVGSLQGFASMALHRGRRPIQIFASDLDETLIGDAAGTARFHSVWKNLKPRERPFLVYNIGQGIADGWRLIRQHRLPDPDFIIGALGTELDDPNSAAEAVRDFVGPVGASG